MKRILSSLFAIVLFIGCTTSHPKATAPAFPSDKLAPGVTVTAQAPVTNIAPVSVPLVSVPTLLNSSQDLAALHQPYQIPARAVEAAKSPAPGAQKTPSVSLPPRAVTAPKSHKLIFWLFTTVLAVPLAWATKKYGLPYFKEFLAFVKSKNVVADLKNLAAKAETKIVTDFKAAEVDAKSFQDKVLAEFSKAPPATASTPPVVVPQHIPPPVTVAAKV